MKLILEGWKKFLKESVLDQEEELEASEGSPIAASALPSEIYYVTSEKYVWNVVEEGILDYKEPQSELEETRVPGVSFYTDYSDELGTRIPFKHVKGVLFPSMGKDKAAKFAERGLSTVKIGQYDPEGSDPKIIYAP